SATTSTRPSSMLRAWPTRPNSKARARVHHRNPTPWTWPRTNQVTRCVLLMTAVSPTQPGSGSLRLGRHQTYGGHRMAVGAEGGPHGQDATTLVGPPQQVGSEAQRSAHPFVRDDPAGLEQTHRGDLGLPAHLEAGILEQSAPLRVRQRAGIDLD